MIDPSSSRFSLTRATMVTFGLALAGAVLGLLRESVVARVFGASPATDALYLGLRVLGFFGALTTGGVIAAIVIPRYMSARGRGQQSSVETSGRILSYAVTG